MAYHMCTWISLARFKQLIKRFTQRHFWWNQACNGFSSTRTITPPWHRPPDMNQPCLVLKVTSELPSCRLHATCVTTFWFYAKADTNAVGWTLSPKGQTKNLGFSYFLCLFIQHETWPKTDNKLPSGSGPTSLRLSTAAFFAWGRTSAFWGSCSRCLFILIFRSSRSCIVKHMVWSHSCSE